MSRARAILGPQGALARAFDGYERREGQLVMAEAVERAIDEDRIVLCEAGTGTGKTLAYLVPALASGRRVVVATASKALQEQIFFKDLPIARRILDDDVSAVLVKGLGNYLCRRRLEAALTASDPARSLPIVADWAARSPRGDIAEIDSLEESDPVWRLVTASSETRLGQRCPHHERCFVTALKREAEASQLLVVNHHLLLADLMIRGDHPGSVLPDYEAVIVDEAHKLEEVATSFFGARVTSQSVGRLVAEALRGTDHAALGRRIEAASVALFGALNLLLGAQDRCALEAEVWSGSLLDGYHALDDALGALEAELATGAERGTFDRHGRSDARSLSASRLSQLREGLATIVTPPARRVVSLSREGHQLSLSSSPIEVGPALRERLFARGHGVVLTSASLTVDERFDFVRQRLGLDEPLDAPIDELKVTSPFDHRAQALFYTPVDLPEVDDPAFTRAAAARIEALWRLTPGGAFVLCTSLRAMQALARALSGLVGGDLSVQGEAPKAALLDRFRRTTRGLLVATMSFWEGVDVPGAALRLVVIDRLPFAVPADPLVRARAEALERRGQSPFAHDTLPRTALLLKQGFGRLLRRSDDLGVVALLDRRLCTRRYGATLLASLPPVSQSRELEDVAAFWERSREAPPLTGS